MQTQNNAILYLSIQQMVSNQNNVQNMLDFNSVCHHIIYSQIISLDWNIKMKSHWMYSGLI